MWVQRQVMRGPKDVVLPPSVRDALSAATRRQILIYLTSQGGSTMPQQDDGMEKRREKREAQRKRRQAQVRRMRLTMVLVIVRWP